MLHPVFGPWDPWVHPLPWDGHQHGATIDAPTDVCPLGPMDAPSSIGRTQHGPIGAPPCAQLVGPMGAPSSIGRTQHGPMGAPPCSALGTHGCTLFHGMDTSTEPPLLLQPMFAPWDPWVLPLPWDGQQRGPLGAPPCAQPLGPMGAPSSIGRTQHGPMGAPFCGMDTSTEPPWVLQPMFAPWDPWVHLLPLEGQQRGSIGAAPHAQPLGPMGAPSSMGWTPAWSHHWCSNQCLLLGTHGCILFHWKDTSMDPLVLHPVLSSWDPWVHLLLWEGHQSGPMGAPFHGMDSRMEPP